MELVKPIAGTILVSLEQEEIWLLENKVDDQLYYELAYLNFSDVRAKSIIETNTFGNVTRLIDEMKQSPEAANHFGISHELISQCVIAEDFASSCSN